MSLAPVTGVNPKFVSGPNSAPYLVRNSGASTVYLGSDSSLTPDTRAITIPAGGSLSWPSGSELWAICDAGNVSELEWLYTAGASFTPGPSIVSAKTVNRPTLLVKTNPVGIGVGSFTIGGSRLDFTPYASIIVRVFCTSNAAPIPADWIELRVFQDDPDVPNSNVTDKAQFLFGLSRPTVSDGWETSYQIPVKRMSGFVGLTVTLSRSLSPTPNVWYEVYGSNEVVTRPRYHHSILGLQGELADGGLYSVQTTATASVLDLLATTNTDILLTMITQAANTTGRTDLVYYDSGIEKNMGSLVAGAAIGATVFQTLSPIARPFALRRVCSAGVITSTAS